MIKRALMILSLTFILAPTFALSTTEPSPISMKTVIQRLDKAGYHQIYKIEMWNGIYHIQAGNAQGQRVALDMDSITGNISPEQVAPQNGSSYHHEHGHYWWHHCGC